MNEVIGGTVIQRSFIGREATNIVHIATVPLEELGLENASPETIVAETLGIPRNSLLTFEDYHRVLSIVQNYPPDYFYPYWHPRFHRRFEQIFSAIQRQLEPPELFGDFISVAGDTTTLGVAFPFFAPIHDPELFSNFELSPQAFSTAFQCLQARTGRTQQTENFLSEIYRYDIPLGQSPKVKTDSLLDLLETSKKVCLAPLAIGGAQAVTQLTQGSYVAALLTTGTAGAMTLVLIGTISVGALIVQRVAQARARMTHETDSFTPPTSSSAKRGRSSGGNVASA